MVKSMVFETVFFLCFVLTMACLTPPPTFRPRTLRRLGQIFFRGGIDLGPAMPDQRLFLLAGPAMGFRKEDAGPCDRLFLPVAADLLVVAVAAGIVYRRVVAEPIGQRLDQSRSAAGPRLVQGMADRLAHGDHVVAVHLQSLDAGGDRLLGQCFGGGLRHARYRDCPLVVVDDEDHGQCPSASGIHRLVDIAL
jgi:hypothetical protein